MIQYQLLKGVIMSKLQDLNDEVLEKVKFIDKDFELSNPLLLTDDVKGKILYMGQETNTWWGSHKDFSSARNLEMKYNEYFLKDKMSNREFWKFIREGVSCHDVANQGNITWSNLFVCSNAHKKGTPSLHEEIKELSVNYLLNIIDYLGIEKVVSVVGPSNPYYDTLLKLMGELGWNLQGWPTLSSPVIYSDNKKLFYTYHPNYLRRSGKTQEVSSSLKEFIKR